MLSSRKASMPCFLVSLVKSTSPPLRHFNSRPYMKVGGLGLAGAETLPAGTIASAPVSQM